MNRTVGVQIEQDTWPAYPAHPHFPTVFRGINSITIDIPSVLLRIGFLTTPVLGHGITMSEFWAWVRYLAAITNDPDLRLTSAFADLDAHQKTILSDDFGMGIPMDWLANLMNFVEICDGRYFLDRYSAMTGVVAHRATKRGPNKTPDFVARDGQNVWHVIECKGTQSGEAKRSKQMGDVGPPLTGGVAQKLAIQFPNGHVGQRLVTGLSIASAGSQFLTNLRIVDPESIEPIIIENLELATDTAQRATAAVALRLAGFAASADVTADPRGQLTTSGPDSSQTSEQVRREALAAVESLAREELKEVGDRSGWVDGERRYRGRVITFDLPRPILVNGRFRTTVTVKQGVNEEVLSELRARPLTDEPLPSSDARWPGLIGPEKSISSGDAAWLRVGDLFTSEMVLR